jgi:electron transfer flavoprotein alpha subunit
VPGTLVVAESFDGALSETCFELLAAALRLAQSGPGPVRALVVSSDPARCATQLGVPGIEEVLTVRSPVEHFEPHLEAAAVRAVIEAERPQVVLTCHSADAMGFAPAVAAELGLGFASGAIDVAWEDGAPVVTRGSYGEPLADRLVFGGKATVLVMLRAGAYEGVAPGNGAVPVRDAGVTLMQSAAATRHLGYRKTSEPTDSKVVMAIGRGVENASAVEELVGISRKLGATVVVSGGLVDAGLGSPARKVGQSGKTIEPRVYLALGISGTPQHLTGVRGTGTIIAVNTDPDAPIFRRAHYGAVADLFEVARALARHFD